MIARLARLHATYLPAQSRKHLEAAIRIIGRKVVFLTWDAHTQVSRIWTPAFAVLDPN
jgi:hypothetical protein